MILDENNTYSCKRILILTLLLCGCFIVPSQASQEIRSFETLHQTTVRRTESDPAHPFSPEVFADLQKWLSRTSSGREFLQTNPQFQIILGLEPTNVGHQMFLAHFIPPGDDLAAQLQKGLKRRGANRANAAEQIQKRLTPAITQLLAYATMEEQYNGSVAEGLSVKAANGDGSRQVLINVSRAGLAPRKTGGPKNATAIAVIDRLPEDYFDFHQLRRAAGKEFPGL